LNFSASLLTGLFINATIVNICITPTTVNRIMPGIKKLLKGEVLNEDKGIPNNLPYREIIKTASPKIAPRPREPSKNKSIFRAVIIFYFKSLFQVKPSTNFSA